MLLGGKPPRVFGGCGVGWGGYGIFPLGWGGREERIRKHLYKLRKPKTIGVSIQYRLTFISGFFYFDPVRRTHEQSKGASRAKLKCICNGRNYLNRTIYYFTKPLDQYLINAYVVICKNDRDSLEVPTRKALISIDP